MNRIRLGSWGMFVLTLAAAFAVEAGTLYRCDDGGPAPIYQTWPCHGAQRLVERRDYATPGPVADRDSEAARTDPVPARRAAAPRAGTPRRSTRGEPASYFCTLGERTWAQSRPCAATQAQAAASEAPRAPRQVPAARGEICRHLRAGRDRGAAHERPSDAAYRRNLMRERENC